MEFVKVILLLTPSCICLDLDFLLIILCENNTYYIEFGANFRFNNSNNLLQ